MDEQIIKKLQELAKEETWTDVDDFSPYEMSGGNYDDAYFAGVSDGKTILAQEILNKLGLNHG